MVYHSQDLQALQAAQLLNTDLQALLQSKEAENEQLRRGRRVRQPRNKQSTVGMTNAEKAIVRCGKKYTVMAQLWHPSFEVLSQDRVDEEGYDSLSPADQKQQDLVAEYIGVLPLSEQGNYQDAGVWNLVS